MTDQPQDEKPQEKAPKVRPMTKLDIEQERIRKREYQKALKEYSEFNHAKIAEKLAAIKRIPDAEWKKAQEADEDNEQ